MIRLTEERQTASPRLGSSVRREVRAPVHAGGFLLPLIPWTVDLRAALLAALSSAISFKAESSSALNRPGIAGGSNS
jgi:hypothetical protein